MAKIITFSLMQGQKTKKGKWWYFWGYRTSAGVVMQSGPNFKTKTAAKKWGKKNIRRGAAGFKVDDGEISPGYVERRD